jgi:hypothetical protein
MVFMESHWNYRRFGVARQKHTFLVNLLPLSPELTEKAFIDIHCLPRGRN